VDPRDPHRTDGLHFHQIEGTNSNTEGAQNTPDKLPAGTKAKAHQGAHCGIASILKPQFAHRRSTSAVAIHN
jgi:hypothetical protein